VLADTGPLYAAADPDDAHHKRSRRELRRLADENHEIIVAYPTLLEAYTLVLVRLGEAAASRWLEDMAGAALVNPSAEDYRHAVVRVQSLKDQSITGSMHSWPVWLGD
jgi:predicted nucleic acid-binding protein